MAAFPGGSISGNIIPSNNGQDLGTPNFRWDAYLQQLDAQGISHSIVGDLTLDGTLTLTVGNTINADITGNVTGNLTGNVTGNVTGNLTGNVTGNVTSAGTSTFADANVKKLNNVRFADQFAGATADVKINAAIADLPSGGGIVDCRGFGATVQTIAATVEIGSNLSTGKTVTLLIDRTTTYKVTITNGTPGWIVDGGSSIIGLGTVPNPNAGFTVDVSAVVSNIILFRNNDALNLVGGFAQGIFVYGIIGATISDAIMGIQNCLQISQFSEVTIAGLGMTGTVGLKIYSNAVDTITANVQFNNIQVDMLGASGSRPVWIGSAVSGSLTPIASLGVHAIGFLGSSALVHPGAGLPIVTIEASDGAGGFNTVSNIGFYGTQLESWNLTDIGILVNGAQSVHVYGLSGTAHVNAGTDLIKLAQPAGTLLDGIDIRGIDNQAGWTNTLNNTVTGKTYPNAAYPRINYSYAAANHTQDVIGKGQLVTSGVVCSNVTAATVTTGEVSFGSHHQGTVGTSGAAAALPTTASGYLVINVEGTDFVIPYFPKS